MLLPVEFQHGRAYGTPSYEMARKYQSEGSYKYWLVVKAVYNVVLFVGAATLNFNVTKY